MDAYIENLFKQYQTDPNSVDQRWQGYFQAIQDFDLNYTPEEGDEASNAAKPTATPQVTTLQLDIAAVPGC